MLEFIGQCIAYVCTFSANQQLEIVARLAVMNTNITWALLWVGRLVWPVEQQLDITP